MLLPLRFPSQRREPEERRPAHEGGAVPFFRRLFPCSSPPASPSSSMPPCSSASSVVVLALVLIRVRQHSSPKVATSPCHLLPHLAVFATQNAPCRPVALSLPTNPLEFSDHVASIA